MSLTLVVVARVSVAWRHVPCNAATRRVHSDGVKCNTGFEWNAKRRGALTLDSFPGCPRGRPKRSDALMGHRAFRLKYAPAARIDTGRREAIDALI
jgi:hypothetical protein